MLKCNNKIFLFQDILVYFNKKIHTKFDIIFIQFLLYDLNIVNMLCQTAQQRVGVPPSFLCIA